MNHTSNKSDKIKAKVTDFCFHIIKQFQGFFSIHKYFVLFEMGGIVPIVSFDLIMLINFIDALFCNCNFSVFSQCNNRKILKFAEIGPIYYLQ